MANSNRSCSVEGCGRPFLARGFCSKHYRQWKKLQPDAPRCSRPDCDAAVLSRGLCENHYAAWRRTTPAYQRYLAERPICTIEGCVAQVKARGLCSLHLHRLRDYGDPRREPISTEARFWLSVEKGAPDDCWPWRGSRKRRGYGKFAGGIAHRFAWQFANGIAIPAGQVVRHTCDNPPCCNPAHLILGTGIDNVRDRVERDRSARGDRSGARLHRDRMPRGATNGNAKLSDDAVREIRRLYAEGGISQTALGRDFGIAQTGVSSIVRHETWTHVV